MSVDAVSLHTTVLFDTCGPVLLVGGGRPDLVPILAASAQEVVLVVPPWREPGIVHDLEEMGVPVTVAKRDGEGLPVELPLVSTLILVDELPACDPLLLADRALAAVAHEGSVCVDLAADAVHEGRFRRLVESGVTFEDDVAWAPWEASGRIALHGRRRAPGRDVVPTTSDLSSLTYVVIADPDEDCSEICADVLLRQTHPAELLLVVDPHGTVDDDLWGMKSHGLTQPAILRPESATRGAWLAAAFEHVESDCVAILDASAGLAPRHAFMSTSVLAAREDAVAVLTSGVVSSDDDDDLVLFDAEDHDENLTKDLWGASPFTGSAVCLRSDAVRTAGGFDASLDASAEHDLWLRLAERGSFVTVTVPLFYDVETEGHLGDEAKTVFAAARERDAIGRLAACFSNYPESERRPTALLHRALALSAAGLSERAVEDLEGARRGADPGAYALTAARVHLRAGNAAGVDSAIDAAPAALRDVLADWRAAARMVERDPEGALRILDEADFETLEGRLLRLFALADVTEADASIALVLSGLVQGLLELDDVVDEDVVTF